MKAESTVMPSVAFEIEQNGEFARVIFYENVQRVTTVSQEDDKYQYDTYSISVRNRPNLEASISCNFDLWLQAAKNKENEAPPETDKEKILRLEKENKLLEGTIMELTSILATLTV